MTFLFILLFIFAGMAAGGILMYSMYVKPRRPKEPGHAFVYVEKNGTVRELNADEELLLERNFYPGDPMMPYIKQTYSQLNEDGNPAGFIMRHKVPPNITIQKKDYRAFNPN